ncbi:MAG: type VI secretion system membrane subunit TssM [Betaproteobacteria bacterium]|nr:type VI secretion system membrane subunit TssM [Betaproteobacteria bacterium]
MKINLFKNSKIVSATGFLILIALIWFVGPYFGLDGERERLTWIFAVMALWVLTLLVGQTFVARKGWLVEKMLRRQADKAVADADAARRAEVRQIRDQLLAAISTLKTSKLGKARGNAALYELPWYMIIGHPSAGKSTALNESGLTFPFSDQGVRGVGGTRNCDWFFTTEGILLDTAGRYATQDEDRDKDRGEWLGFLRLLKRHRSKAPLNGILVACSLPELDQYQSENFTLYARQIRERIQEVEDTFEYRIPVFLIFTKMDLLGGFAQFFGDLNESDRDRVWGATLPSELEGNFEGWREAERQCELLYRGLAQMGEDKLGLSRGVADKSALFGFPHEFHRLKEGVSRLIELLHEEDPYHTKPLLRGFYFTSALQSNEPPRIAAAARLSRQFGLVRNGSGAIEPSASHSYFLRGLFHDVVFPDQHLILRQTQPRANRLRLGGMLAGFATLILCIGLLTQSWLGNGDMLAAIRKDHAQASTLLGSEALADKLKGLTLLQKHLEVLQRHRERGAPWQIGVGLYQGQKLEAALRRQYFNAIRSVMLEPLQARLEASLRQFSPASAASASTPGVVPVSYQHPTQTPGDTRTSASASTPGQETADKALAEERYNALKTYLMLGAKPKLETAWLSEQLPRFWQPWLESNEIPPESIESGDAGNALKFYLSQITAPDVPLIENDEILVDQTRNVLRHALTQQPVAEKIYSELIKRANTKFPSLTVDFILNGKDIGILTGNTEVPGAFTREAYDKYLKSAIIETSRGGLESADWVLSVVSQDHPVENSDSASTQAELEALYRADYAKAWMAFLNGLAVADPNDIPKAGQALARLSDSQKSPIKIVLQRAVFETAWDNPSKLTTTVQDARQAALDKTVRRLQDRTHAPDIRLGIQDERFGPLGVQFAFLLKLAGDEQQPSELMTGYLERLGKLKTRFNKISGAEEQGLEARELVEATLSGKESELVDTMQYVDDIMLASGEAHFQQALRPLLTMPLIKSYIVLLPPIEEDLNLLWADEVYENWKELSGKFPFSSSSRDEAEFLEIGLFLSQGGALDSFVETTLGSLVTRRGNQIVVNQWNGRGVRLNQASLINIERLLAFGAMLKRGGETGRFELQPVPTPGLSDIRVEIDGQTLLYRNGPQPWKPFKWPSGEQQGVRIQVVALNGTTATVFEQSGRMGLIRALSQSTRAYDPKTTRAELSWRVEGISGAESVKLNFNMVGGLNPMQLSALKSVSLPQRIAQ